MSDLPDTPFCRVLPSGHEVHWWDKSGNECLCGVAAKVGAGGKPRGECPDCGRTFQLTTHGRLRHHLRPRQEGQWYRSPDCSGTGQEPVLAVARAILGEHKESEDAIDIADADAALADPSPRISHDEIVARYKIDQSEHKEDNGG